MPRTPHDHVLAMPHWHPATCTRVVDGDTVRLEMRLGLGIEVRQQQCRLLGIETPELAGDRQWLAQAARATLSRQVLGHPCYAHVPGDRRDRYGRWLIWLWQIDGSKLISVNAWMIATGHAWEWWPQGWGHTEAMPPVGVFLPTSLTAARSSP